VIPPSSSSVEIGMLQLPIPIQSKNVLTEVHFQITHVRVRAMGSYSAEYYRIVTANLAHIQMPLRATVQATDSAACDAAR
jgi:hypothetical protein